MVTSCSQNREVWFGDNGKQLSVPKNKTEKNVSVAGLIFFICLFILCLCVCVIPPRGALLNEGYWTHMHIQNGTRLTASQGALSITAVFDPGGKHWFFFFPHFQDYMIHFEVNFYIFVFLFCLKKRTTHDVILTLYANPTIMSILQHIHCIHTHLWFISKTRIVIWIIVFFPPTQQNTWLYKFA